MNLTFRPLSLQIFTTQKLAPAGAPEAPPAAELPVPEPDAAGPDARVDRRLKHTLKDRVQAGSAGFDFDALLQGVSTLRASPTAVNDKDGAELVWIPSSQFLMGSDSGELHEQPVHPVYIDGFWMYKTPVTVGQYRRFYSDTERSLQYEPPWGWQDGHPVVNVSWEHAMAYAQWAGASLPTEAEWERAARGVDGREYPWGDEWEPGHCCNSVGEAAYSVAPVGRYPQGASPEGALDMAGNVWEWTADWYEKNYYAHAPARNPCGPMSGTHRIVRGGSWGNDRPEDYRAATRVVCAPTVRGGSIGFRCIVRADALPEHFRVQDAQ